MSDARTSSARRLAARITLLVGVLLAVAPVAAQADPTPVYYPLNQATHLQATSMVTDPSGTLWFGAKDDQGSQGPSPQPPIGKFVPSQMTVGTDVGLTLYRSPTYANPSCCATSINSLAFDNTKNRLWWARNDGLYGFGSPGDLVAGTDTGFSSARTPLGVGIQGMAVDQSSHAVWMAENGSSNVQTPPGSGYFPGHRLVHTDDSLGLIDSKNIAQQGGETTLNSLRYDAGPMGVSLDAQGNAWFAESDNGNPGYRIARTNGSGYIEYLLNCHAVSPCSGSYTDDGPVDTAVAPDGSVWFINQRFNTVGKLDLASATMTEYSLASIDPTLATGLPRQIRFASDGTLWLAESSSSVNTSASNAIIRIVPTAAGPSATVFSLGANRPFSIATSATGDVWFSSTTPTAQAIGRLEGVIATSDGGATPTPVPAGSPPVITPPITPAVITSPPVVIAVASAGFAKPAVYQLHSDTITAHQICVGPPQDKCSLVFLLDTREFVRGFPGSGARVAPKAKPKPNKHQEIGSLSVTLNGGETKDLKIRLNKKARAALKKQGHIKSRLTVSQKLPDGTLKVIQTKTITFKRGK